MPYPIGTDRVMDGDNAFQALAERVDLRLGKWTAYNPTFTGIAVTNVNAQYCRTVDLVTVRAAFKLGASISAGWYFTLPTPAEALINAFLTHGLCNGVRTGVRVHYGQVQLPSTVECKFIDPVSGSSWGNTFPATWLSGDDFACQFTYRPAAAVAVALPAPPDLPTLLPGDA